MLTEITKTRFHLNLKDIKQSPGWRFVRQIATAEAAEPDPDFDSLRAFLMEQFALAIDEEIQNGINRQKAGTGKAYPGAVR